MPKAVKLICLLAALSVLYTGAMLAAYAFPDSWIAPRVIAAVNYLEDEGNMLGGYSSYFWHSGFGITDNITDKEIYNGLMRNGRNTAQAAMRTDYARYWHGYAVLLRPLSIFLSIIHIRYINMMVIMGLLILCYYHARKRLGSLAAAGLLMTFILIAPFCQQYCPVTYLTLLGCYALLRFWERVREHLAELFVILGSLVCFFDFLTFPVLALGYPLAVALMLLIRENRCAGFIWKKLMGLSAAWMAAYALTWISKAPIGSLLSGENMLGDIINSVVMRTTGATLSEGIGSADISILSAFAVNLESFLIDPNKIFIVLTVAVLAVRMLRKPSRDIKRALPIAAVALYPFIWYSVMQNHVRVHFWMTYKQLSVTVFAVWTVMLTLTQNGFAAESGQSLRS